MPISLRRGMTVTMTATLIATALLTASTSPASADATSVYTVSSPLPAGQNGDVVKSQPSTYNGAKATRIQYLSRDNKDKQVAVSGTVLVPSTAWSGPGERPIVAYAPFTFGMGAQCAPSKTLAGEGSRDLVSGFQNGFVDALLGAGFAVAQTDYLGPWVEGSGDHPYVNRLSEAHTVLDVVRAAQRLPGTGLPGNGPVGIAGYSEGGSAAAAAAELASTYAPELNVKGVYSGAPPADKAALAKSLDGGIYLGFLGYALIGINQAYPEANLVGLANPAGAELFLQARQTCTLDAVFKFMFKQTSSLTKNGQPVSSYLTQPPFDAIIAENRIGNLKPAMPTMVQHSPTDDVIPAAVGKQMAKDWCGKGANVQWKELVSLAPFFSHALGMPTAATDATAWLRAVFSGQAGTGNCGRF
ncbi:lipase family protein [Amycolatopsis sp. BJA-103]|uniref:lipase family protein n=1 Tax=unclassified Amycolatopsis TaxID=2618356 RepID=UPI000C76B1BF|nr:lipase family protein [Amycolatopsis sp. BJA-103]AUI60191.1 lipase [Amycolatopsis sp. BJA-103]PNE13600.1 lipase [Amycolatopsis sp. BJA-103]